jgi:hypothetical protein
MPLHDWAELSGWEGVHHLWITELLYWVKPRLPEGYRAYIGSVPTVAIGAPGGRPDVGVRAWPPDPPPAEANPAGGSQAEGSAGEGPDVEVAVAAINPDTALYVETGGRLVAAVELISPRNKDRPDARAAYLARYLGYLHEGVHLLLVDVHPRPRGFSFADSIARELGMNRPACPPPYAVSYRVGEPAATGGRLLAIWQRTLAVGAPLPSLVLPLTVHAAVPVDLEQTYARAAQGAYLA